MEASNRGTGSFVGGPHHFAGDTRIPNNVVSGTNRQNIEHPTNTHHSFVSPVLATTELHIREGMKVADFGAGSGAYTRALARAVGETGTVYAIEVQQELANSLRNALTRENIENIEVIWGNFENSSGSKLADNMLDYVLISNTLFQLENKNGALKEAYRILKNGGALAIIDWSESFAGMGPPSKLVVSKNAATLLATDAGFARARSFDAGAHHYGLIFTKPGGATHTKTAAERAIETEMV